MTRTRHFTPSHFPSAETVLKRERRIRSLKRFAIAGIVSFLAGAVLACILR